MKSGKPFMKIFKHRHKFPDPGPLPIWKAIHQDIIVNGNHWTRITMECECGAKKDVTYSFVAHKELGDVRDND